MRMRGRVLAIAGSDSGGGAGIQADIKAITALGGYAATAVTAITVQDTIAVREVLALSPALVSRQIACVLADPGMDAVKTGMLADAAIIEAVIDALSGVRLPLVVDPVMVATSGDVLLAPDAVGAMRQLLARATLATPNAPEAARLCGHAVADLADMRAAAGTVLGLGAQAVLVKGGHLPGAEVTDLLLTGQGEWLIRSPRHASRNTHGTGCTLASAAACGLAQGMSVEHAVRRAIAYVNRAIAEAPGFGAGHGPLNHAVTMAAFPG